jgi:serine/threonine protein kinase
MSLEGQDELSADNIKLPNFTMLRELGRGGMGVVFLARQESLDREVAVKVFPARGVKETNLKRFFREVQLCVALSHPHVVKLLDAGATEEWAWLAMECIQGQSLDRFVLQNGPMRQNQLLATMEELSDALDFCHENKIIHRDIKPANVMKPKVGSLKLMDFGLARGESSMTLTDDGAVVGSPRYLAPETVTAGVMNEVSDLYGLGFLFYEVATATRPYDQRSLRDTLAGIVREKLPAPSRVEPSISPGIDEVIMKLLAKKPEERFQSAKELLEAVRALRSSRDFIGTSWETSRPELNLSAPDLQPAKVLDPTPPPGTTGKIPAVNRPSRKVSGVLRSTGSFAVQDMQPDETKKQIAIAAAVGIAVFGALLLLGLWAMRGNPGPTPSPTSPPSSTSSTALASTAAASALEKAVDAFCASLEGRELDQMLDQLQNAVGRRAGDFGSKDRSAWVAKAHEWLRTKPFSTRWREVGALDRPAPLLTDAAVRHELRLRFYHATLFLLHLDDFTADGNTQPLYRAEDVIAPWTTSIAAAGRTRRDGLAFCEKVQAGGRCMSVHNRSDEDPWYRFVNHQAADDPVQIIHAGADKKVQDDPLPVADLPGPYQQVTFLAHTRFLFIDRWFQLDFTPLGRPDGDRRVRTALIRARHVSSRNERDALFGVKVSSDLVPPGRYEITIRAFRLAGEEPAMWLRELWAQTLP